MCKVKIYNGLYSIVLNLTVKICMNQNRYDLNSDERDKGK